VRFAPSANGAVDYSALAVELAATPPDLAAELPVATEGPVREVIVRYRDADAGEVRIAGDFNGWIPDRGVDSQVESEGSGRVWTKVLRLPPGTYQYRYVVDGEWRSDPDNPRFVAGPVGGRNSLLVVR
jgi:hypothetical protein